MDRQPAASFAVDGDARSIVVKPTKWFSDHNGLPRLCYSGTAFPKTVRMRVISHGLTDAGCCRSENQDRIFFDDALGLYIVCDGLGGRRRGGFAAELAVGAVRQYIDSSRDPMEVTWPYGYNLHLSLPANRLWTGVKLANRQIWRQSETSLEHLGMGTTVSAVLIQGETAAVANIGDSRVYLFRDSQLQQLTVDDTLGGAGSDSSASMVRHILTRAAGSQEDVEVGLQECRLLENDKLLLCSDGLHGCVPSAQIAAIFANSGEPAVIASALVGEAQRAGAPDNISVIVLACAGSEPSN